MRCSSVLEASGTQPKDGPLMHNVNLRGGPLKSDSQEFRCGTRPPEVGARPCRVSRISWAKGQTWLACAPAFTFEKLTRRKFSSFFLLQNTAEFHCPVISGKKMVYISTSSRLHSLSYLETNYGTKKLVNYKKCRDEVSNTEEPTNAHTHF